MTRRVEFNKATDTVYYTEPRKLTERRALPVPSFYFTIDWLLLAKQHQMLWEQIDAERGSQPTHPLDGVVALIDALRDDANERGLPVVWYCSTADWVDMCTCEE